MGLERGYGRRAARPERHHGAGTGTSMLCRSRGSLGGHGMEQHHREGAQGGRRARQGEGEHDAAAHGGDRLLAGSLFQGVHGLRTAPVAGREEGGGKKAL